MAALGCGADTLVSLQSIRLPITIIVVLLYCVVIGVCVVVSVEAPPSRSLLPYQVQHYYPTVSLFAIIMMNEWSVLKAIFCRQGTRYLV